MRRATTVIIGISALLAGCAGSSSSTTSPSAASIVATSVADPVETTTAPASSEPMAVPTTVTDSSVDGSAVCSVAGDLTAGTTVTRTMTVGSESREYLVRLPAGPADGPLPLVVDFHGAGSNMDQQAIYSGFDPIADREGFVVATPNGVEAARRLWRFLGDEDVEFARALVEQLVADACVDPERVFAAGLSSGAAMSATLACRASDVFRGFGLVAANGYQPALCARATPRPMVVFHGTDDAVVPYEGGDVDTVEGYTVQPAEDVMAAWAEHHGCDPTPTETPIGSEVIRLDWNGCEAPLSFHRIVGGGHTWPGSAIDVFWLGATTDQVEAAEVMWSVFEAS